MPGGNGTGPMGMGPMTGRAAGYCAGFDRPGFMNPMFGRGFGGGGWGRGGGRGRRNMYFATGLTGWQRGAGNWPFFGGPAGAPFPAAMNANQQAEALKNQAASLERALEDIRRQIDELQAKESGQ